jgi:hypothetical protein
LQHLRPAFRADGFFHGGGFFLQLALDAGKLGLGLRELILLMKANGAERDGRNEQNRNDNIFHKSGFRGDVR